MDFVSICNRQIEKGPRKGETEIYPDFRVGRSKDLMVRGRSFYAIWDETAGLWSTDEYDVQRLVDQEMEAEAERLQKDGQTTHIKRLGSFGSNSWTQFRKFIQNISDNSKPLDENLAFINTEVKKSDYVSRRLPYSLEEGSYEAWNEIIGTLYNPEERAKLEWAIGAVISGDAKKIQKFIVLYGPPGSGKGTIINVLQLLFQGYIATFEAKALGNSNAAFATEVFKDNPLVAIQHDGDLSKIEDNSKLNSIISHEDITMNEKYKPGYTSRVNAFLFMGTNQPVKISDAKSGIIRRLIDVHPTGITIPTGRYHALMSQIEFELGAIAQRCLNVYLEMGKNYYSSYRPLEMMFQTDVFFNFIEAYYDIFLEQNGTSLKQAYVLYKEFCVETGIDRVLPQYKVREELRNYFDEFHDRSEVNGILMRSVYTGFSADKFKAPSKTPVESPYSLVLEHTESLLDDVLRDMPAQYGNEVGTPSSTWATVHTTLDDLDTSQLHFVKVPHNHIVIDFDLKDENGEKSLRRNLESASSWPATYAELSQGGGGVHLHYNWTGSESSELASNYSDGIEVKVYSGNASLRRRLSQCNGIRVADLNSGLPLKERKVLSENTIKSERGLRDLVARNLRKEIHPGTKPSVDFIHKVLEDAYSSGMTYDLTDLRPKIIAFANNSSNQSFAALKVVQKMKWKSDDVVEKDSQIEPDEPTIKQVQENSEPRLAFFDLEVYPNLFVVCWKFAGAEANVVKMINPTAQDIEALFRLRLVGYNNRRYDNHILWGAFMGYDNAALYKLSQKLINNDRQASFGEAYNVSYADIYDFTSKKQTLKRYQIDLGLPHIEMDLPWDQPVPDDKITQIVEYCANDVYTTEATFDSRKQDFVARQILADLSGLTPNDPTPKHTARIIFGKNKTPQQDFIYTNLSKEFPGYEFDPTRTEKEGKSSYRGENPSEGGYVYAEHGVYEDVAVLDVASMHPSSLISLNYFGDEYTPRFKALLDARIAIKRQDYDKARKMLDGKLADHLGNVEDAKALSYALKIVINIVYGLTAARFPNVFRDNRNVDNIVAKRGALFMIDLKNFVQEKGYSVVHIKTDSIKIPGADQKIIDEVFAFGKKYGYDFEHEATYKKFCLVNDAVYIAREDDRWEATGAQFAHPYVYKKLFTGEEIVFNDLCETKQVTKGSMYLQFEVDKPYSGPEGLTFVGRSGQFTPVKEGVGGGMLWRIQDEKNFAVAGTKGYLWMESEHARSKGPEAVNMQFFEDLCDAAVQEIEKFGSFEEFVS
jgi:hypothetical protein